MFKWQPLASLFDKVLCIRGPMTVYYLTHVVIHHKRVVAYTGYRMHEFLGFGGLTTVRGWFKFLVDLVIGRFVTVLRVIALSVWSYKNRDLEIEPRPLREFKTADSTTYDDFTEFCMPTMLAWAAKGGNKRRIKVAFECLLTLGFLVTLVVLSWKAYLFVFVPAMFLGNTAMNYLEYCSHYGVYSEQMGHDGVSAYGKLYNWFFFNNGLHAEHHLRPKAHWSTLYEVRKEMPPESERKVVGNFLLSPFSPVTTRPAEPS
jgi:hypothetical protein